MRRSLLGLALLAATSLSAAEPPPHPPALPDDFTPSACAPANSCQTYRLSDFAGVGHSFLGYALDPEWIRAHGEGMIAAFGPTCRKHATCLGTPGNNFLFCDDAVTPELLATAARLYPKEKDPKMWEAAQEFTQVFALGMDQRAEDIWKAAQRCVFKDGKPPRKNVAPIVWMDPAEVPLGYRDYITFYAVDPETHVPVQADISIEDNVLYAPANPAGTVTTYYPFKLPVRSYATTAVSGLPFHLVRKPAANGHTKIVPPTVTIKSDYYQPVSFPMAVPHLEAVVSMTPAKLRTGKQTITVTAKDSVSGKPVELRVMAGEAAVGTTNEPIELDLPRGKHPEIWVTSLYGQYDDYVVLPAGK